jgi:hypothetical protein
VKMGKSSKEKVMGKLSPAVQVSEGPKNSGYISLRWERLIVDGKKQTVMSVDDGNEYKVGENPLRKEYTDPEEFKKIVFAKIDKWVEKAE